jgi:hypothetical protein
MELAGLHHHTRSESPFPTQEKTNEQSNIQLQKFQKKFSCKPSKARPTNLPKKNVPISLKGEKI